MEPKPCMTNKNDFRKENLQLSFSRGTCYGLRRGAMCSKYSAKRIRSFPCPSVCIGHFELPMILNAWLPCAARAMARAHRQPAPQLAAMTPRSSCKPSKCHMLRNKSAEKEMEIRFFETRRRVRGEVCGAHYHRALRGLRALTLPRPGRAGPPAQVSGSTTSGSIFNQSMKVPKLRRAIAETVPPREPKGREVQPPTATQRVT